MSGCDASRPCSSVVPERGQPTMKTRSDCSRFPTAASAELAISLVAQLAEQAAGTDAKQELQDGVQLARTRTHPARVDRPVATGCLAALAREALVPGTDVQLRWWSQYGLIEDITL